MRILSKSKSLSCGKQYFCHNSIPVAVRMSGCSFRTLSALQLCFLTNSSPAICGKYRKTSDNHHCNCCSFCCQSFWSAITGSNSVKMSHLFRLYFNREILRKMWFSPNYWKNSFMLISLSAFGNFCMSVSNDG